MKIIPFLRTAAFAFTATVVAGLPAHAATYVWAPANAGGNWSDTTVNGWNTATTTNLYPNAAGDIAIVNDKDITGNRILTIDVIDATVGYLRLRDGLNSFGSFAAWEIASSDPVNNKLIFDSLSGNAILESDSANNGNSNTISAPIQLNDSLSITGNSALMTISGVISEGSAGKGLLYQNSGQLTLSGTSANSYTGGTVIQSGSVIVGVSTTLGADVTGNNVSVTNARLALGAASNIGSNQTLTINTTKALSSGRIAVLGLPSNALPVGLVAPTTPIVMGITTTGFTAISDLGAFGAGNSYLGSTATGEYAGASLGVGSGNMYRLGGGGGTLTVTNGVLTGSGNGLTVGVATETGQGATDGNGTVILQGNNDYTGATLINPGSVLTLSGASGAIASSSGVTANSATLNLINTDGNADRIGNTAGVTLRGSTLALTHNTTTDTTETIGALTIGVGPSNTGFGSGKTTITATTAAGLVTTLAAASLTRQDSATALIRGTNLGSTSTNSTQVTLASTTGLSQLGTTDATGGAGTTTNLKIVPWLLADTSATGTGSNFATYDATQGFRPLGASETVTFATLAASDENVRGAGEARTSSATMNSLFLTGTNLTGAAGVSLNVTSGGLASSGSLTISAFDAVNLGTASNKEALIHTTVAANTLTISSLINPLTDYALTKSGAGQLTLGGGSGDTAGNTYTGVTTVNEGTLRFEKASGTNAVAGNLIINGGGIAFARSNQIADTASVTVNAGGFSLNDLNETVANYTQNGGSVRITGSTSGSTFTASTSTTLNGGFWTLVGRNGKWTTGTMTVNGGNNSLIADNGNGDAILTVNGDLIINQTAVGEMTPFAFTNRGANKVSRITLNGATSAFTFNGNASNTNSAIITSLADFGGVLTRNQIMLTQTNHNFTVTDGGAAVDLIIQPSIVQSAVGKGITKLGAGTLQLDGASSYTGATKVDAGRLLVNGSLSATSAVTVNNGGTLGGSGTVGAVNVIAGGTLAPGNSPGTINTGNLTLPGSLSSELSKAVSGSQPVAGTDYDQVNVTGTVNLAGGDLVLTLGTGLQEGDLYFLVRNDGIDGITGEFSTLGGVSTTLTQGSQFTQGAYTFLISYTGNAEAGIPTFTGGNDLALQVIPEPQTWAMLLSGAGVLTLWQRTRRRRG
jgi:fibronectin-binding autotransporter adhesin